MTALDDMDLAFCWQVEVACRAAWPAVNEIESDGWLLRASGGTARRNNSANPLDPGAAACTTLIERVESYYAGRSLPTYFRIPDLAPALDPLLEARGYAVEGRTHTLFAGLGDLALMEADGIEVSPQPSEEWLDARDSISGASPQASASVRAVIARIELPRIHVAARREGRLVSLLVGVRAGRLVIPESVMTDVAFRGRRLAAQCMSALVRWGVAHGCTGVALQVDAANEAGLASYRRMGFRQGLYDYHYRVRR